MGLSGQETIPYPKSVFFIVTNEFCERFSYYGMRTILSLYLNTVLLYNTTDTKIIYHMFTMLVYFFPLFGAILSDSFLGKFRTILYVSMVYALGNIVLSMAAIEPLGLPQRPFSLLGLLLLAIGTGGIKPCVSAFGGDQFVLPQQELQLAAFFSMFYFAINAGSLISTFLTPILREDVYCFGSDSCFPLAFAVPGLLMIISIVVFALGKPLYTIRQPEGNVVVKVSSCIGYAIKKKMSTSHRVEHWLDHSVDEYGKALVDDIKSTLKVLVLFIPLPIFWALFDQQGTGWTFQAIKMNGDIGFYTILPDQMQVINPLLILAFIPLFTYVIYPTLGKCNILKTPLQRMVCGGVLTAISFGISACISLALESSYPLLPTDGMVQMRFYNGLQCNITINDNISIPAMGYHKMDIKFKNNEIQQLFDIEKLAGCDNSEYAGNHSFSFHLTEKTAYGLFLHRNGIDMFEEDITKSSNGWPKIRTLVNDARPDKEIIYLNEKNVYQVNSTDFNAHFPIHPGKYELGSLDIQTTSVLEFRLGGVYTVLIDVDEHQIPRSFKSYVITEPNSLHILWLVPQYVIITAGEIMFSITGLEFSYSQAPTSMKSVLQAAFLLTTAVGNLLVVIIESAKFFKTQSSNFFLYTALMCLDMLVFAILTTKYKYVKLKTDKRDTSENSTFDNQINENL